MYNYGPDRDFIELRKNDFCLKFVLIGKLQNKDCYEIYKLECDTWMRKFCMSFDKKTSYKKMFDAAHHRFFNPVLDPCESLALCR